MRTQHPRDLHPDQTVAADGGMGAVREEETIAAGAVVQSCLGHQRRQVDEHDVVLFSEVAQPTQSRDAAGETDKPRSGSIEGEPHSLRELTERVELQPFLYNRVNLWLLWLLWLELLKWVLR